ncbi:(E)-4-hydroxy-3-methylbut-2-enyl-diphosphate synthase [Desulfitispora alkaliphila]
MTNDTIKRRPTSTVAVGNVLIGSEHPVVIQSMTNTDTRNAAETIEQINLLASAGCEIVRVAVPDEEAADALVEIVRDAEVPVVADIHFDYRLALRSIENGVSCLRINPGNIGSKERVREVVLASKDKNIPIRIGVNAGSLEKEILHKYGMPCSDAMVESAMGHIALLEDLNYNHIKVSLKASDVPMMIHAYKKLAAKVDYPFHIGVTEAGSVTKGTVKSAVGIGSLLAQGIGDTIRVSLTGSPLNEVPVAKDILQSLGLRKEGLELISCPTCGRCQVDLQDIVERVEDYTSDIAVPIKVAVMGCVVNGPGEAREADIGIAGGKGEGLLFKKGEVMKKLPEKELVDELLSQIEDIVTNYRGESNES